MKRLKSVFATFLIIFGMSTVAVEAARQIGEFNHFRITTRYAKTGYLVKNREGNFVVNLESSRHLAPMTVKTRLVNSNNEARSDERLVWVGERRELDNWARSGYIYALDMARQNWWDGAAYITGSWSPDN